MPARPLFPTWVHQAPLNAPALVRWLLDEARRLRTVDGEGRAWCAKHYPNGYTSYATFDRLHRAFTTFAELERRLAPHVKSFAKRLEFELGGGRLRMTDCWVNVMGKGAVHGSHLHPLSVLSGTYYLRIPAGAPGLRLEDPRLDRFMGSPPRAGRGRPHVDLPVRAGSAVLFESWLRHEVPPNPSREERVSVSFNYDWVRATE